MEAWLRLDLAAIGLQMPPSDPEWSLRLLKSVLRAMSMVVLAMSAIGGHSGPAQAQDSALQLLPQEQPASRQPSIWNFFQPVAPKPAPVETEAVEDEAQPAPFKRANVPLPPTLPRRAAAPVAPRPATSAVTKAPVDDSETVAAGEPETAASTPERRASYQPARVPLPPVIHRSARNAPVTSPVADAPIAVTAPPQPRPTGLFAMLAAYSEPERTSPGVLSDSDSARPVFAPPATSRLAPPSEPATPSARTTKLDLSDPFRPKRLKQSPDERDDDLDDEGGTKLVEKQVDSVEIQCLKPDLMAMIYKAGDHFGATPVITSGFRNRGRRGSHHRKCEAADFFIPDVASATLVRYLRALPGAGGVGTYCHTKAVHLDVGEPRNWHQCGRRRSFALRAPVTEIGSR